jgi:hypothetical protein
MAFSDTIRAGENNGRTNNPHKCFNSRFNNPRSGYQAIVHIRKRRKIHIRQHNSPHISTYSR